MNEAVDVVGDEIGAEALTGTAAEAKSSERPWVFGLMIAPSSVVANGVIQGGILAYLMSRQSISGLRASQIISLLTLPTTIYFLWSPITDFLMRRRTWLLLGSMCAAVLMVLGFEQKRLDSTSAVVLMFLSACCSQLVVSSCGGMMGALRSERAKRLASGFYQSGGLGFGAASVFVLVMVFERGHSRLIPLLAGALIAVPALFALAAPKQEVVVEDGFGRTMRRIWGEFKETFLNWRAVPYTLMMLAPLASGAAIGLLTGVARSYGVGGQQVAWMNGLGGAALTAVGSLAATLIPERFRASVAYLTVALVNAATLGVLWLGPLLPATYYLGVTLYLFTVGMAYAMFTAVVLEFLGSSGKSGSGRYSIINSLGNVPVVYMLAMDGWGGNRWGARGLAGTEAVMGAVGATVLLAYFLTRRRVVEVTAAG
jgi:MFS transporter, PAT family, beta-lactamase induction signal transducer AmpG